MLGFFKKYLRFFLFLFILCILIIYLFYNALSLRKNLAVYTPSMVNPELVDKLIQYQSNKQTHRIEAFNLINQNGDTITNKDYEGKIYVADFFFTSCKTICPIMGDNMIWLQEQIKDMPNVKLLSHTVTPEIDSVAVLKAYAIEKGVNDDKWNLVTGNKKDIFHLARQSYLAVKTGSKEELYDMVHTENFILVDGKGRVRGFYDGTNLNTKDSKNKNVSELLEDIKWLIKHESK